MLNADIFVGLRTHQRIRQPAGTARAWDSEVRGEYEIEVGKDQTVWYSIDWKMTKVSHGPDCWKVRNLARGENPCRTSPLNRLPSKKRSPFVQGVGGLSWMGEGLCLVLGPSLQGWTMGPLVIGLGGQVAPSVMRFLSQEACDPKTSASSHRRWGGAQLPLEAF